MVGPVEGRSMSHPILAGVSVLCIDNYIDALEILRVSLEIDGAKVETAASGDEALFVWKQSAIDVVVCDLLMPNENGIEVLQKLRRAGFGGPAIALSGVVDKTVQQSALSNGFLKYLVKPVDNQDLVETIATSAAGRVKIFEAATH